MMETCEHGRPFWVSLDISRVLSNSRCLQCVLMCTLWGGQGRKGNAKSRSPLPALAWGRRAIRDRHAVEDGVFDWSSQDGEGREQFLGQWQGSALLEALGEMCPLASP